MMEKGLWGLLLAACCALVSCGGGGDPATAATGPARQPQALAASVSLTEQARQVMDFAENRFPALFPGHETTGTWGPIAYRYYAATGVYLGVVVTANATYTPLGGVYVMGGPFGGAPRGLGSLTNFVSVVDPTTYILDSFGQIVAGGSDGVGTGDSGADGTAGDGAPIVGATVVLTDANGRTVSAVTDTVGHFRVKVTGFTPPFVARVTKADGSKVYTSLNVRQTVTNGYITINISGLTDKISSDVARAGGKTRATELTPQIVASNTAAIQTSIQNLQTTLAPVITAAGISSTNFDPIGTAFRPNHSGYDYVLDNTVITVAADGSTQVGISPTFTPGYAGTWSLSITTQGYTVPVGNVPGSNILTQAMVSAANASLVAQQYATSYSGYTVAVNGNTVTITGANTNYTITINNFSFTNYQGCGTCGVGSTVSYTLNVSATSMGTMDGTYDPGTTISTSAQFIYKRVS